MCVCVCMLDGAPAQITISLLRPSFFFFYVRSEKETLPRFLPPTEFRKGRIAKP